MSIQSFGRVLYLKVYGLFSGSGLYAYPVVRRINKWYLRQIRQRSVNVNGLVLHLDRNDSLNLSIDTNYEPAETAFLKRTIQKGDCVVDVGANIGYYTTLLASLVGETGKVYAFEPDRENVELLRKNVEANGFKNVFIEPLAVSDKSGEVHLYYSNDKGDQRIYDSLDGRPSVVLQATSLDDYFRQQSLSIDFIKMDIQGAEGKALQGMRETVSRSRNVVLNIEFWPYGLEKSGYGSRNLLSLLDSMQLNYHDLNNPSLTELNPDAWLNEYTPGQRNFTNLICTHNPS